MFTVKIRWGSMEQTQPFEYSFVTEAGRDAFLYGVEESSGWMDYELVEDDKTAETVGVVQS
jgi:hypothetical protein